MTSWNSLPNEMKCEIWEYLNEEQTKKLRKSLLLVPLDPKDEITILKIEKVKTPGSIQFIVRVNDNIIVFEQIGKACKIQYDEDVICRPKKLNKTMIHMFFEQCFVKSQDSLKYLKISKVNYKIRDKSIKHFPKLQMFEFVTVDKSQLYSFLKKSANVTTLSVKFKPCEHKKCQDTKKIDLMLGLEWRSLQQLNLVSTDGEVTCNILRRLNSLEVFLAISSFNVVYSIAINQQVHIYLDSKKLLTNLALKNDLFVKLSKTLSHIKCDGKNLDSHTIKDFVETYSCGKKKKLILKNIEYDVIEEPLDFRPSGTDQKDFVYRKPDSISYCKGSYDLSTKVLDVSCGEIEEEPAMIWMSLD